MVQQCRMCCYSYKSTLETFSLKFCCSTVEYFLSLSSSQFSLCQIYALMLLSSANFLTASYAIAFQKAEYFIFDSYLSQPKSYRGCKQVQEDLLSIKSGASSQQQFSLISVQLRISGFYQCAFSEFLKKDQIQQQASYDPSQSYCAAFIFPCGIPKRS